MQRAFAAMHQANGHRLRFTLEYGRLAGSVSLFLRFPPRLRPFIETPLVANYPGIAMERIGDDTLDPPNEHGQWSVTVRLRPDLLPIKWPEECEESDPIAGLLATLGLNGHASCQRVRVITHYITVIMKFRICCCVFESTCPLKTSRRSPSA